MESWASRKKRSRKQSGKTGYDQLPKDLKINIMNRLPAKDLARAMSVSKSWFKLILLTCYPLLLSLTVPLFRLLHRVESKTKHEIPPSWLSVCVDALVPYPHVGLNQLATWCSKVADCRFAARKLIDSCNGLLLFCHKSRIENAARAVYYYYVINPVTKKCVAILKPRPSTAAYTYAALAYDPAESEIFKIIGFQGLGQVNVFSSKTGNWTSLQFQLPLDVIGARWLKNSVYLNGAIYRLSSTGHLIKFLVDDPQENPRYQAVAIRVPLLCHVNNGHWDIGVRHKKIVFFMSAGTCLIIWELVERFDGGAYIFNWCQTHRVIDSFLSRLNDFGQLLAIHPYNAVAIFKHKRTICYYFYCHSTKADFRAIGCEGLMSRYITSSGFLLLEYSIPRRLDKKVNICDQS